MRRWRNTDCPLVGGFLVKYRKPGVVDYYPAKHVWWDPDGPLKVSTTDKKGCVYVGPAMYYRKDLGDLWMPLPTPKSTGRGRSTVGDLKRTKRKPRACAPTK